MKRVTVCFLLLFLASCAMVEDFFSVDISPNVPKEKTAYAYATSPFILEKTSETDLSAPFLTALLKPER